MPGNFVRQQMQNVQWFIVQIIENQMIKIIVFIVTILYIVLDKGLEAYDMYKKHEFKARELEQQDNKIDLEWAKIERDTFLKKMELNERYAEKLIESNKQIWQKALEPVKVKANQFSVTILGYKFDISAGTERIIIPLNEIMDDPQKFKEFKEYLDSDHKEFGYHSDRDNPKVIGRTGHGRANQNKHRRHFN